MAKDWTKTKPYRALKQGLEDNLEARGLVEPVYRELLRRYMELWCEFQELTADIRENGVSYILEKTGERRENRSITIRHQTSQKMLDIYNALGFRELSVKAQPGAAEDDEL